MNDRPFRREMALRNIIALGLKCSPDFLQRQDLEDFSILGRWGDPAGFANADSMTEIEYDRERFIYHKYVVGYFILTLINIYKQCGTEEDVNDLNNFLFELDDLTTDKDVLRLMDDIIDRYVFGEDNEILERLRNCLENRE